MEEKSKLLLDSVAYPVIAFVTVLLNTVEIILLCKRWRTLKTYEQLLLSLAVSDVLVGLSVMIFGIIDLLIDFPDMGGVHFMRVLMVSFVFSLSNLFLISIDRLVAVRFPLKHKTWITRHRMKIVIIIIWIIIVVLQIIDICLPLLEEPSGGRDAGIKNFYEKVPWIILSSILGFAVLYTYIIFVVVRHSMTNTAIKNSSNDSDTGSSTLRVFKLQQPVITTCLLVVICYVACTCPLAVEALLIREDKHELGILFFTNTAIDPIIYFFKGFLKRRLTSSLMQGDEGRRGQHETQEIQKTCSS